MYGKKFIEVVVHGKDRIVGERTRCSYRDGIQATLELACGCPGAAQW
jgi:hypothetical protein